MLKKTILSTMMQVCIIAGNFIFGIVMAQSFGATKEMDAYVVVANFIALIFGLFSHIQSKALLPHLANINDKESERETVSSIFRFNNLLFLIVTLALFLFSNQVVFILAPGLSSEQLELAEQFMRISSGYLFFSNITSLGQALMEYHLHPFTSLTINILRVLVLVLSLLLLQNKLGIYSLPLSHLFSLIALIPLYFLFIKSKKYSLSIVGSIYSEDVKKYVILIIPIFVGQILTWLIKLSDSFLASFLSEGTLSHVSYSLRIVTYFSQIFGGFHVIIYPLLSRLTNDKDNKEHITLFYKGFELLLFIASAATLYVVIFSNEIVSLLFERGSFTNTDSHAVSLLIRGYALMLLCAPLGSYFANIYYSRRATRKATLYSIVSSVINIVLNFILVIHFKALGLAIASSIAFLIGNILQGANIGEVNNEFCIKTLIKIILKTVTVVLVSGGILGIIYKFTSFNSANFSTIQQAILLAIMGLIFSITLILIGIPARLSFLKEIHKKINKKQSTTT